MSGVRQLTLFVQHLHDAVPGFVRDGDQHEHHGEHHQAHKRLEAIHHQRGKLTHIEVEPLRGDDGVCAEGQNKHHVHIQAKLHDGAVEREDFLGLCEFHAHLFGRFFKLLLFIVLAHEGLYHADALNILLNGAVERVVLAEHPSENGEGLADDEVEPYGKDRYHHHKDERQPAAHDKCHYDGENEHQRASDGRADDHHVRVLDVAHIRRQPCDKRRRGEPVDILKGKGLDAVKHVLSEVARKTA